jgi:hypothetical protein
MTVCPWCKASNPPGAPQCLKCGKRAADHPSIAMGQQGDDRFDDMDEGHGPALDLELGVAPGARSGGSGLRSFGDDPMDGDDDDADGGPAPALELDAPALPARARGRSPEPPPAQAPPSQKQQVVVPRSGTLKTAGGGSAGGPQSSTEREVLGPAGSAARPGAALQIDAYEVRALADYGEAPQGILHTVPYAVRVTLRQRELRRALAGVRAALTEGEKRRDDRLVELGQVMRPEIEGNPDFAAAAAPLADAEKTKRAREEGLQSASGEFRQRVGAIDQEIALQDEPLSRGRAEAAAREKAWESAEELRKRHEARRKRVEIEVRNAQAKLERAETPPGEKQQATALIQAAQGERATRSAEEKLATDQARDAEAQLALARRAVSEVEAKIADLRKRRRAVEDEFARQGAVRMEGIDAASREVRGALLEIGRRLAKGGLDPAGYRVTSTHEAAERIRKLIAEAEAQVSRLQYDLEKHLRALDVADDGALKKGRIILVAVVVLLLGSFIAWRALRTNPYMEAPKGAPSATSTK